MAAEEELHSWKEIARHLGVSVRTAQAWEHVRALPVQRLRGPRGRVSASVAELDAWRANEVARPTTVVESNGFESGQPVKDDPANTPAESPRGRPLGRFLLGVPLVAAAVVLATFLRGLPGSPTAYRVESNAFVALDSHSRESWRKPFPSLCTECYTHRELVWMGELDGERAVLFAAVSSRREDQPVLVCYTAGGRERWRFTPGRTVHTRAESFQPPFGVSRFLVGRFGREGKMGILVTGFHYLYYPCQVALLSTDGRVLREYWHSGHLNHAIVLDGGTRVLLGGVNNAAKAATLVSLDPDTMNGASVEQDLDYQLEGFAPGAELARLIFPRSDLNKRLEPYVIMDSLWKRGEEVTALINQRLPPRSADLYYHFNLDLTLRTMVVGSGFEQNHAELFANRVLDHGLNPGEIGELRQLRVVGR